MAPTGGLTDLTPRFQTPVVVSLTKPQEMLDAHAKVEDDFVGFRILDQRFHSFLWELAGRAILERICYALYNMGLDTRRKAMHIKGQIAKSTLDHEQIIRGVAAGDEDAAAEAMYAHINNIAKSTRLAEGGSQ